MWGSGIGWMFIIETVVVVLLIIIGLVTSRRAVKKPRTRLSSPEATTHMDEELDKAASVADRRYRVRHGRASTDLASVVEQANGRGSGKS